MSASKIDHKELQRRLKEDELSSFFQEILDNVKSLYESYGRQIVLGLAIVLIAVCAYYVWSMKSESDSQAAQTLYSNAVANVQSEQYPQALNELTSLIKGYSGSKVAIVGLILRGDCYFKTGEFNLALLDYKNAIGRLSAEDALVARFAIAQTLRSLGKADEALQELDAAEKQAKSPIMKEQILYLRGGCYEDKNDTAKALESYKAIPSKSRWYSMAIEKIAWLEAQPVAAINVK